MNTLLVLGAQGGPGGGFGTFWPFLLILVVFWFFMIRPQMKKQKELRKFREELKKGDKIVTTGGIYGKVADIQENAIIMEVDDKCKLKVDKAAVIKDMSDVSK
jgi:preprotein translocase subunit YajC